MPIHVASKRSTASARSLSPEDWLNVIWVVSRVMGIVGHPPAVVSVESEGTPGVMWVDPDDNYVVVVLDYETDPARLATDKEAAKMIMHISERASEGITLALVGLCTMRDVRWDIIPSGDATDDDENHEQQTESDTKPGS